MCLLKNYPHPKVMMGPIGPVTAAEFSACNIYHAAYHLSFLVPALRRRVGLQFANVDDLIADVRKLQRGYQKAGNWSLEQACWHLNKTTLMRLQPAPYAPNTPEQDARAGLIAKVLETGVLPQGLVAPDPVLPPMDADASSVKALIETLEKVKSHSGPFAPHRLFGHMSEANSRKQILIHAAHHLSHLVPTDN